MSAARRSLLTATAAGTLLGALWFVPSANATQHESVRHHTTTTTATTTKMSTTADETSSDTGESTESADSTGTQLADTGSVNTTPYVIGGTLFLGIGAGFVVFSVRRERMGAY